MRASHPSEPPALTGWLTLLRAGARVPVGELAPLTVLATLPGWGASTWLRQAAQFLERDQEIEVARLSTRAAAHAALTASRATPQRRPQALIIDGLIVSDSDPLWDLIYDLSAGPTGTHIFIRSLDNPVGHNVESTTVVTEADLALTPLEIDRLARLNRAQLRPGLVETLATRYRGNPSIVRHRLEHRSQRGASSWPHSDATLQVQLAADLGARLMAADPQASGRSTMLTVFRRAMGMRRTDARLLAGDGISDHGARTSFARLTLQPFGEIDVDAETGESTFEWHDVVWDLIGQRFDPSATAAARDGALHAARREGHVTVELLTLLSLGRLEEADQHAYRHLRLLTEHAPPVLAQALASLSLDDVLPYPSLALCSGYLQLAQQHRTPAAYRPYLDAAAEGLAHATPAGPYEVLRNAVRRAFAHVSAGERAATARALALVDDVLGDGRDGGVIALGATTPAIASTLAGELHLALWCASQIDDLDRCVRLADVMLRFPSHTSRTASTDLHNAVSAREIAGLPTPAAERMAGAALADPFALMAQGDAAQALQLVEYMSTISGYPPSCSTADSLILLVRALLDAEHLTPTDRRAALESSIAFWSDGAPSSVVLATSTIAAAVCGEPAEAWAIARLRPASTDMFTSMAHAVALLGIGRASDAATVALRAEKIATLPRARATLGALASIAQVRLGTAESACLHLAAVQRATGAALTRFALRLATDTDLEALAHEARTHAPELLATLAAAQEDPRPLASARVISLTPVERNLLLRLREGLTYPEIAQQRFVSLNTVRTQTRALLRKLGAKDRHEAVSIAAQYGLFDDDPAAT